MAASAIDEAIRNCVAVGADPSRIALLDNFCWGYTDRPETLGSLVRAALACYDLAVAFRTPFISGKDSLNNEFSYLDQQGQRHTIAIPPSLLISALGQVPDVRRCVTMDLKEPGNGLYQIGLTRPELGGSHFARLHGLDGGQVPQVDVALARRTFPALHSAIVMGWVRSCHDLSEGGLAVASAEMALAGGCGAQIDLDAVPEDDRTRSEPARTVTRLFAESNTRFLCEVRPEHEPSFVQQMRQQAIPCHRLGAVETGQRLIMSTQTEHGTKREVINLALSDLKRAWQQPLHWR
jgi:phosphoribosylformylglycinamidine synthase